MIKIKAFLIGFLVLFAGITASAQTIKGYTEAELDDFSSKVEDQVRFLEYLLNTIGSSETNPRDKDVVIRESYLKIFRDAQVQVEDDLLLDRKVITNKNVTSYLKDIEFFYKKIDFELKIREVKPYQKENGDVFFVVSLDRTINAVGTKGETITNTKPRFIEVNLDSKSDELKIASVYTTKLSRDEELREWWGVLSPQWQGYFTDRFGIEESDSVSVDLLYKFVSVDSLDISNTDSLLDLSPMEAMRDLRYVNLSNTKITELGPISNVTFLEYLDVSNTPAEDIQFIKYSDRLNHLDISNTGITDINELANLKSLKSLKAEKTPIMSFAVLNEFDSLKSLVLPESGFNNADNIKNLNKLEELDLSRNYLINFSALSSLTALKNINLSETNVTDLSPLDSLEKLEVIDLTGTPITDIAILSGKPNLVKVLADETELSVQASDDFIRKNPKVLLIHHTKDLESWWASLSEEWKTSLRNANPMITEEQPNVEILTLTIGMESLDLKGANIETLNPVTRFVKLHTLDFSDNPVSDLIPLSVVKTLKSIKGENTEVRDLSPLKANEELENLDFGGSPVESILDVVSLPNLSYLNVNNSEIFEEEVPELLIQKPELNIIYRSELLEDWWKTLSPEWRVTLSQKFSLPENPDEETLHRITSTASLGLESVSISNLEALQVFNNLRSLSIFDAPFFDISPLSQLTLLTKLKLSQVPVNDFSPISKLHELEELDISNTGIENLSYLSALENLRVLNISGTNLRVLKGLEGLNALEELDVASTNLRSLRPIQGLPNLKKLSCFNTRLSSRAVDIFRRANPDCEVRFY